MGTDQLARYRDIINRMLLEQEDDITRSVAPTRERLLLSRFVKLARRRGLVLPTKADFGPNIRSVYVAHDGNNYNAISLWFIQHAGEFKGWTLHIHLTLGNHDLLAYHDDVDPEWNTWEEKWEKAPDQEKYRMIMGIIGTDIGVKPGRFAQTGSIVDGSTDLPMSRFSIVPGSVLDHLAGLVPQDDEQFEGMTAWFQSQGL